MGWQKHTVMRKKLLIPTDFSRNAWDAIVFAVDLHKEVPCDFFILNVYDYTDYATDNIMVPQLDDRLYETLKENSEKGLEKILQRLNNREIGADHNFITISQQNNLLDAIHEVVEMKDIDLVVMGTKGDTDSLNKTFGSNTVMIMEKIRSCPVLAVPPDTLYTRMNEIVFPTDYRTHFKKLELDHLKEISRLTHATIRIVHIAQESELDAEQRNFKGILEEDFDGYDVSFHTLESEHINEAVDIFVQARGSDMLAFVNKKHTFFTNLFSKPMVKELGMKSKVPVLALHDHSE